MNRTRRIALGTAAVVAALAAGTATASAAPAPPPCSSNDVDITMQDGTGDQQNATYLHIAAMQGRHCTILGHVGGLQFFDANYAPLPTNPLPDESRPVTTVAVHEGQGAEVNLSWPDLPGDPSAVVPAFVQFSLPGATDGSIVAWEGGPVGEGGTLRHSAVVPAVG